MSKTYKYRFLEIYRKYKDIFIKPKFKFFIGKWRNEGNLPVWRRGNLLKFAKYGEYTDKWNYAKLVSCEWNPVGKKNHPILSKLVKPMYELPIWLSFYIFNSDIMYKTKWSEDDYRYEYPAHFTIVFFGLCFSITAYISIEDDDDWLVNDQYWESLLTYSHYKDLEKTNDACGWYNRPGEKGFRFKFNPKFLKKQEDRDKLKEIQDNMIPSLIEKYKREDEEYKENHLFAIDAKVGNVENNKFDGWFYTKYNNQLLVFENEEDRDNAFENLKKEIQRKKNGELKKIEYVKFSADKRYISDVKTWTVLKSDLIDKNIDITNKVYGKN